MKNSGTIGKRFFITDHISDHIVKHYQNFSFLSFLSWIVILNTFLGIFLFHPSIQWKPSDPSNILRLSLYACWLEIYTWAYKIPCHKNKSNIVLPCLHTLALCIHTNTLMCRLVGDIISRGIVLQIIYNKRKWSYKWVLLVQWETTLKEWAEL